MEEILE